MAEMKRALMIMLLFAIAVLSGVPSADAATASRRWVDSWEAPAVDSYSIYFSSVANSLTLSYRLGFDFLDQSERLILTTHAGGDEVRVVISNEFGHLPLKISAATVAEQAKGAQVVSSTLVPLTFNHQRSITVPGGGQVTSDPARITVKAFEKLAVSLWLPNLTLSPTGHYDGLQTSYLSTLGSGNQTTSINGAKYTSQTPMRFFVTGVQVLSRAPAKTIVAVGDSITDGGIWGASTANQNARWPDFLQHRLLSEHSSLSVVDAGIAGNQLLHGGPLLDPSGGPSLESRFQRDVLDQPNLGGIILLEGINDIGLEHESEAALIAGYESLAARAHAAGVPIVIATLTPMQGASYADPYVESTRAAVNHWILTQHVFNGVINFAAAVQQPSDHEHLLPAFDSGDNLHPNASGFKAMAEAVSLRMINRLFGGLS
jgi:lysophospholipase L1-like esterase